MNKKIIVNEERHRKYFGEKESIMKYFTINSNYSKCEIQWEKGVFPETFEIEYLFRVAFNYENIITDFGENNNDRFKKEFLIPYFSENSLNKLIKKISLKNFTPQYVVYSFERNINTLLPFTDYRLKQSQSKATVFGFYIICESKFKKAIFENKHIIDDGQLFSNQFDKLFFENETIKTYCKFIK